MKKSKTLILGCAIALSSASLSTQAIDLKSDDSNYGKLKGMVKALHILDSENNGYDPSDGSAYLIKLKYISPKKSGFQLGLATYTNGDLGTRFDYGKAAPPNLATERTARGMFVDLQGDQETQLGEFYVDYSNDKVDVRVGRQMYGSPLTTNAYSTIPNLYTAYGVKTSHFKDFTLGFTAITEMSQGARSVTDWSLIGEGTNTAGSAIPTHIFGQGEFNDISVAAFGPDAPDTNGIYVFNADYKGFKNTKLNTWYYMADDIANNLYVQSDTTFPVASYKLAINAQLLNQSSTGQELAGDLDFTMIGAKVTLKGKGWNVYLAANSSRSGDTAMFNAWGGDPAFTSSIFSRNAYRENADAYKVGFMYKATKELTLNLSHANYWKSDTSPMSSFPGIIPAGAIPNMGFCVGRTPCYAANDATETDLVMIYKPAKVKGLMLKLFLAKRESEYNDAHALSLEQSQLRFITVYKF